MANGKRKADTLTGGDSRRPSDPSSQNINIGPPSGQENEDRGGLSEVPSPHITVSQPPLPAQPPMPSPESLRPLLLCPLCNDFLSRPTTLHCGHSICAFHVTTLTADLVDPPSVSSNTIPLCPLEVCAKGTGSSSAPHIPHNPRVHYHPTPPSDGQPSVEQPATVPKPRIDVTLDKIISLVSRTESTIDSSHSRSAYLHSDDDSEPSGQRPLKRRRRQYTPPQQEDDHDDLLSHLRKQVVRERTLRHDEPILSTSYDAPTHPSRDALLTQFSKELLIELTCEICFVLLYQPITTPCQHTFCAKCLQRSLDHSPACPLCRQDLPGYIYFRDHPVNKKLLSIILQAFPAAYRERGEAFAIEERGARLDTPIFVCQLSLPGTRTFLHLFEPRYRLMLRRCLESQNPSFGMILAPKPGFPQLDYGTMLEIRSVQMLADGRSMVEAWGTFRFRILERGNLDGYMVARIEKIDDHLEDITASTLLFSPSSRHPAISSIPGPSSRSEPPLHTHTAPPENPLPVPINPRSPTNEALMDTCRQFLDRLQRGTAPWVVQRLSSAYGTMPTDPSAFSFWIALVLPIDEHEKVKLLPLRSARLRLLLLVHWIEQLNSQWYAFVWRMIACLLWTAFVLTASRLVGFI